MYYLVDYHPKLRVCLGGLLLNVTRLNLLVNFFLVRIVPMPFMFYPLLLPG